MVDGLPFAIRVPFSCHCALHKKSLTLTLIFHICALQHDFSWLFVLRFWPHTDLKTGDLNMATAKKAAPKAKKIEDFTSQATASMQENFEKVSASMAEMGSMGQENMEAVVESATIFAKGVEEVATEQAAFTKEAVEKGVEQFKAVASVKTPQEFIEAQTDFMREAFEANIAQMTKLTDMWTATTKDASQPLNKRYTAAVEKMQSFRV
jgi:phasin family protein